MSQTSSLSRYYPQLLLVTGVIVALGVIHLHHVYTSQPKKKPKQLRRRNAQRARNRLQSFGSGDSQQAATAETLSRLDGTLPPALAPDDAARFVDAVVADPISLPTDEALTTMLNNAGAAARGNREDGNDSDFSYDRESKEVQENQNVLQLLYLIAEDQAKQQGYVHRGVTCNLCNVMPIRGVRYRCSNCIDFDLCESCEAQDIHPKTHLFYKVRIPAPFLGSPQKTQQPVYPGRPSIMAISIPPDALKRFTKETCFEPPEIEALYEQFKCLAANEFPDDPNGLGGGIDRKTFDKCFVPNNHLRPPPPNLIYDRMFAFFDTDGNGLIGFEEFVKGLSIKTKRPLPTTANMTEKYRRTFRAYDLDGDGYIERRDVLKMFRAYYALQKDLVKDLIAGMEDDVMESTQSQNVIHGSQPLSAAFSTAIPHSDTLRRVKTLHEEINDIDRDALRADGNEQGRRTETIASALQQHHRDQLLQRSARRTQRAQERLRRLNREAANSTTNHVSAPTESSGREPRLREVLDDNEAIRQHVEDTQRMVDDLARQVTEDESFENAMDAMRRVQDTRRLMIELGRHVTESVTAENSDSIPDQGDNFIEVINGLSSENLDDMIQEINMIVETSRELRGENAPQSSPATVSEFDDEAEELADEEAEAEAEVEAEDHIPDTVIERVATPAPPREEAPEEPEATSSASQGPPWLPQPDFEPQFGSTTFDLPGEWTTNIKDPIRRPIKEELKLFYLEDYYKSDDEASEDDYMNDDLIKRKKASVSRGLEREEDVGREILCQVVEQGINEMLDALFLEKERHGLEVYLWDRHQQSLQSQQSQSQSQQGDRPKPSPSTDENKENIDKTPPGSRAAASAAAATAAATTTSTAPPTIHIDPENPFSVLGDTADARSQNSSSTASDRPFLPSPQTQTQVPPTALSAQSQQALARVRKELASRGGPGRVSEQEFINYMNADSGKKLAFMITWISMGSF
ncbi:hypothetical protein Dda_3102 [Drechslerella dactyloides]|uniref:Uncharacterized protein n=1 Tax=Drechslerella dactyloides TaxID=74499 RepID=A0AAD6J0U4_DREDA|nr:hypothetical protein Dda_3102 [Drechslerella dactyloides]